MAGYGINEEEWQLFLDYIVQCDKLTLGQISAISILTIFLELFALAALPTKLLSFLSPITLPIYHHFKKRNLQKHVLDGHISSWTCLWNSSYFAPKGVVVGFHPPGYIFRDTFVHPKERESLLSIMVHGQYKKPMSKSRAARRARIVIVRVKDPVADAGKVPDIRPMTIPRIRKGQCP